MAVPTKILFVIDQFRNPHAGTEGQLFQLVKHLDRSRFEPHFLVFINSCYLEDHGFICDYTVLGHQSLSSVRTWLALWRAALRFRRSGFRLAHVFFNDPSIICPPVFSSVGIRTLISRRDMGYWYTPLVRAALRHTRRYVSGALVNSEAVKGVTARAEKIPASKIHVIYNGYDVEAPEAGSPPIAELGELKEQGYFLAALVANIRPIKRIEDLILALAKVSESTPELHVVIIGAGDSQELAQLASSLRVSDRVHFLGARPDVKQCLRYLDVGVLCSESEGFSNAIVEYLHAGMPVICTDTGGNPEAVREGKTGLLYPVGDVDRLGAHLSSLASNPVMLREMSDLAKEDAQSRFSLSRMVREHEYRYSLVADDSSRGWLRILARDSGVGGS